MVFGKNEAGVENLIIGIPRHTDSINSTYVVQDALKDLIIGANDLRYKAIMQNIVQFHQGNESKSCPYSKGFFNYVKKPEKFVFFEFAPPESPTEDNPEPQNVNNLVGRLDSRETKGGVRIMLNSNIVPPQYAMETEKLCLAYIDGYVSGNHLNISFGEVEERDQEGKILAKGRAPFVKDLGSTNGTFYCGTAHIDKGVVEGVKTELMARELKPFESIGLPRKPGETAFIQLAHKVYNSERVPHLGMLLTVVSYAPKNGK